MLHKISIDSGQTIMLEPAKNRHKANFDMSVDREKLAVVESLLAQSDII